MDADEPTSVNRAILANTEAQSSSLLSVIDSNGAIIADRSPETNPGRVAGDRPPHVSHYQYDIV
jgi:hypothetical protein